ncbi:DUF4153 domain-containing protein [uncultured Ruegeria sp.]|uniref:DUF4153 domain-containing protein n=1 Tax=uncultured Ruegeria sp. TaxID=259304 RepID=UPI002628CE8A|nr:DUF4173 domain-containing protein [uncultured Ruegeria sp.]
MGQFIVRGIPASVLQDSWWLDTPDSHQHRDDGMTGPGKRHAAVGLVVLIALADVLFFDHPPGLSLAIFTLSIAVVVWALLGRNAGLAGPAFLLTFSILPVVEYVQALSVAFLIGGSIVALCWAVLGQRDGASIRRFLSLLPVLAIQHGIEAARHSHSAARTDGVAFRVLREWSFPAGGALILTALMISANPVLSDWIDRFWHIDLRFVRLLFWLGTAIVIWPFLAVPLQPELLASRFGPKLKRNLPAFGVNAQSVANALIVFNLLLAVQTGLDMVFLWGYAELPDGMSFAEYAHRGAYPLLATALLAGAFALVARPYLNERQGLKKWMMLWLVQNVLLVISSLMRLSLYIESYGLTYLRIHAAIWMALVAVGLCLTGWQILRSKSNRWLLLQSAVLGFGVLYACCFINFAALIARWNIEHPVRLDMYYACQLNQMAAAELMKDQQLRSCATPPVIENWRDWGFRADRVIRSLAVEPIPEKVDENPRRG